jgi:nucleotide-binding universal stress UspA family protein
MTMEESSVVQENSIDFVPRKIIMIPVDGSAISAKTVSWTVEHIAEPKLDQIVLVNVRSPDYYTVPVSTASSGGLLSTSLSLAHQTFPWPTADMIAEADRREEWQKGESHKLLQSLSKQVVAANINCRAVALRGEVRAQLDAEIDLVKPDFIVMGRSGKGALSSILLGSVANHIAHTCKVPVIFYQ